MCTRSLLWLLIPVRAASGDVTSGHVTSDSTITSNTNWAVLIYYWLVTIFLIHQLTTLKSTREECQMCIQHFFKIVLYYCLDLGHISFRWIWNMFHFIVPENKIMMCCFKKRYVSKLCFRISEACFPELLKTIGFIGFALKSPYRSPGYKKNQLVLCKNYVL
jgi:hypothetical protein